MSSTVLFASFLVFFLADITTAVVVFPGRTTACDTCDNIEFNSVRNILCCTTFSKCCIPDTIDGYEREARRQRGLTSGLIPNWSNVGPVAPLGPPPPLPASVVSTTKKPRRKKTNKQKKKPRTSNTQNPDKTYANIDEKAFKDLFERSVTTAIQRDHPGSKIEFI